MAVLVPMMNDHSAQDEVSCVKNNHPRIFRGLSIAESLSWAVTKALIWGGCIFIYIRDLPDECLLKSTVMTTDFKRNSSGRTRIYEYAPPPPQLTLQLRLWSLE